MHDTPLSRIFAGLPEDRFVTLVRRHVSSRYARRAAGLDSLAANGPKFQLQPGEIATDMDREASGLFQFVPVFALRLELEITKAGVERDLPRRHRQRLQADAGHRGIDQLANALDRGDSELRRQMRSDRLLGQVDPLLEGELVLEIARAKLVAGTGSRRFPRDVCPA